MKKYLIIGFSIFILNNYGLFGQKGKLHFNQDGEFKIVQFTDTHLQNSVSEFVFELVKEIVELEKPDLVVITGDVTFQDSVYDLPLGLAKIFADKEIHWVSVFGNHDDEAGPSRKKLSELYQSLPFNLNSSTTGIKGETNFILPVAGKKSKHQALLYFFDSNAYNPLKDKVKGAYGWIDFSQIHWYRNQSASYTKENKGVPVPSLAFFHIPLPEYKILWEEDSISCIGMKQEGVSCPMINSGIYTSMLECGDIMGIFVGHDHENDYIGSLNGIALAYGRFSGTKNTYGHLTPGARVIVLKEGNREFETWIRVKGGNILYKCRYPYSFK
jgi:3',5'-cyclic AMP phosphodiesterase CpdA